MMSEDVMIFYPTIEGNVSNFVADYIDMHEHLDKLINFNYGERVFEHDIEDIPGAWDDIVDAIVIEHINEWARLYYALNEDYNPLYNVDGTEETTYGEVKTNNNHGTHTDSTTYGASNVSVSVGARSTTTTNGAQTNTSTDYSMSYPNTQRHEANHNDTTLGASSDSVNSQAYTDTTTSNEKVDSTIYGAHTDTSNTLEHKDTLRRFGNIGVVSTTKLLEEQKDLYTKKSFFMDIFQIILLEGGLMYE